MGAEVPEESRVVIIEASGQSKVVGGVQQKEGNIERKKTGEAINYIAAVA